MSSDEPEGPGDQEVEDDVVIANDDGREPSQAPLDDEAAARDPRFDRDAAARASMAA